MGYCPLMLKKQIGDILHIVFKLSIWHAYCIWYEIFLILVTSFQKHTQWVTDIVIMRQRHRLMSFVITEALSLIIYYGECFILSEAARRLSLIPSPFQLDDTDLSNIDTSLKTKGDPLCFAGTLKVSNNFSLPIIILLSTTSA